MKIGIIVFSRTGNTLSVAENIRKALISKGHEAAIERIHAEHEEPNNQFPLKLTVTPSLSGYDAAVLGAAVEGFSISPVLKAYLEQLPMAGGKRAACFVTQHLSKPWLGGNRAIRQAQALCKAKGLDVRATGIVNWSNKARDAQIAGIAAEFARL